MRSTKLRIMSVFVLLVGTLAVSGLFAPGASALDGDLHVSIQSGPTDAAAGDLITAIPFDPTGGEEGAFVTVHVLVEEFDGETTTFRDALPGEVEVKFRLATGDDLLEGDDPAATGTLTVDAELTGEGGIATFDSSLSITPPNQPFTTNFYLVPQARYASEITLLEEGWPFEGTRSERFDIWGDGCRGNGCSVNLTPGQSSSDSYTTTEDVGMGASELGLGGTTFSCPGQLLIFSTNLFFHATTGDGPVFLVNHISEADRKAAANNGQKFMGWCMGLKTPGPWNFARQDTNGDGSIGDGDLFVGMAPKCPKRNAMNFAPCIERQTGDGVGGSIIRGWVPGGDPPRRT